MKLTASKMTRAALASANSGKRISSKRRFDGGLVSCTMVGVGRVGVGRVGFGRVGFGGLGVNRVGADRVGVGVGTRKGTGSCKSGKGESRDDFELHVIAFLLL